MPALDGLRAFAVAVVILRHTSTRWFPGGFLGVDVFFALSGYLITSLLVQEYERTGRLAFGEFYWRRAARLTPALGLMLAFALPATLLDPANPPLQPLVNAATYTINWAMAFGQPNTSLVGHTWSLACEEQFYLLWPPVLILALRSRHAWAAPALATGLAAISFADALFLHQVGAIWERTYMGFDCRAVELLIGCAFAFVRLDGTFAELLATTWFAPAALLLGCLRMKSGDPLLDIGGYAFLSIASAWLVIALRKGAWIGKPLSWGPAAYVGRISYGLYLWHYPIVTLAHDFGLRGIPKDLVTIVGTFAVSALSFHFFETPIIRWARRVSAARRPAHVAAPALEPAARAQL